LRFNVAVVAQMEQGETLERDETLMKKSQSFEEKSIVDMWTSQTPKHISLKSTELPQGVPDSVVIIN